jgi:hypothetical protein
VVVAVGGRRQVDGLDRGGQRIRVGRARDHAEGDGLLQGDGRTVRHGDHGPRHARVGQEPLPAGAGLVEGRR